MQSLHAPPKNLALITNLYLLMKGIFSAVGVFCSICSTFFLVGTFGGGTSSFGSFSDLPVCFGFVEFSLAERTVT